MEASGAATIAKAVTPAKSCYARSRAQEQLTS